MPCVAIVEAARAEVKDTRKQGDEHVLLVSLAAEAVVHLTDNLRRTIHVRRETAKDGASHRHHDRRRHAFAAHVAHAEEQPVVADIEVKQVAAYLLGRDDLAVGVEVLVVGEWRETCRQHRHLNLTGDVQLVLHALVASRRFDETFVVPSGVPDNQHQHSQTQQHQQAYDTAYMIQVAEEFLLRDDDFDMPPRGINLFLKDVVLAPGYGVRCGNDLHARVRADGVIAVRINLQIVGYVLQLVQRHVDTYYRHHLSAPVAHGVRAAHHVGLRTRVVQVRFAPPAAVVYKAVLPPFHLRVVVRSTTYLTRVYAVLGKSAAARFEERANLGEVIRHECHRHARVRAQRAHRQTGGRQDGVRLTEMFLRQQRQCLGRSLHLDGMHVYLQLRTTQFCFCALLDLLTDSRSAGEIHQAGDSLQRCGRHEDNPQPPTCTFALNRI